MKIINYDLHNVADCPISIRRIIRQYLLSQSYIFENIFINGGQTTEVLDASRNLYSS